MNRVKNITPPDSVNDRSNPTMSSPALEGSSPKTYAQMAQGFSSGRGGVWAALADNSRDSVDVDISNGPAMDAIDMDECYSDPVFKQLAVLNGQINRMTNDQLRERLHELRLDPRGSRDVRQRRLKAHHRAQKLRAANLADGRSGRYLDFYVIIDFEATCEIDAQDTYRQEIIEFPAVLISSRDLSVVDEFHSFVRPVVNPKLSAFCMELTGVTQDIVNVAPEFPSVVRAFEQWLDEHGLLHSPQTFAIVTDGPWDMGRFMFHQCQMSELKYPDWAKQWVNMRKSYSNFYNTKRVCLRDMLATLGLKFEGRPHCGRDDARNIARVVLRLITDGGTVRLNEGIVNKALKDYFPGMIVVKNITKKEVEAKKKNAVLRERQPYNHNTEENVVLSGQCKGSTTDTSANTGEIANRKEQAEENGECRENLKQVDNDEGKRTCNTKGKVNKRGNSFNTLANTRLKPKTFDHTDTSEFPSLM